MESAVLMSSLGPFSWGILETRFGHQVRHCCCCWGIFASCCFQQAEPGNISMYMHVNTHTQTCLSTWTYMCTHICILEMLSLHSTPSSHPLPQFFLAWPCSIFVWSCGIVRTQQDQCISSLLTSELHQEYFTSYRIHTTTCNKPTLSVRRTG